jgi:hypothetical protein
MKPWIAGLLWGLLFVPGNARGQETCSAVAKGDLRWQQLDGRYARIERATVANDAKQLFAGYATDFEARMLNGEVWTYKKSAAYSTAGFEQVKENLSISHATGSAKLWPKCSQSHGFATVVQAADGRGQAAALSDCDSSR